MIQLWLILTGGPDPNTGETVASVGVATRMIQTLSFFTIQSNILMSGRRHHPGHRPVPRRTVLAGASARRAARHHHHGLVFDLVLIHYVDPTGWQLVATIGFHYIAPWATVLGWLLFGPRPRIDRSTIAWAFVWPLAWIAYTFVRGALVDWYPYPFLDVAKVGYGEALGATAVVLAVAVVLVAIFRRIDRIGTPSS